MQSATVPKQLAKNVTLILHPWIQVVRRGLCQYLCFLLMPENTLQMQCPCCQLFLLYANSVFGWQNQFRKTATMHTLSSWTYSVTFSLCCFHTFSYFFASLFNIICLTIYWVKHLWPLSSRILFTSLIPISSLITHFYILFILSFIIWSRIRWPLIGYL